MNVLCNVKKNGRVFYKGGDGVYGAIAITDL